MDSLLWLEGLETQRHILNQPQEQIRGHHRNPEIAKSRRGSVESETEGPGAGIEVHQETGTRCLSDLVKGAVFDRAYTRPVLLASVYHVLDRDFNLLFLNARDAIPGERHRALHADWRSDYDGRFHVCSSVWLLDDFTNETGCTRLVPETHREPRPSQVLEDTEAPHPQENNLIAPAGTMAVFNSHFWHASTCNRSSAKRRSIHCYFAASEHPQQTNQREYLRYETWKRISPVARYILDVDLT